MSLIFRYGFDYLRNVMLNLEQKMVQFLEVLQFLSCAYSGFHSRGVGGGGGPAPPPPPTPLNPYLIMPEKGCSSPAVLKTLAILRLSAFVQID
jgi:hypothetical protein